MKTFLKFVFSLCLLGLLIFGVYFCFSSRNTLKIKTVNAVIPYQIERATTPEQQRKGLMGRNQLPAQNGMLFLFNPPRVARMWMKDTLIPLDMLFFDEEGRIVFIHQNARPLDKTVISSRQPVAGVLEINAGEAEKFGITLGAIVDIH